MLREISDEIPDTLTRPSVHHDSKKENFENPIDVKMIEPVADSESFEKADSPTLLLTPTVAKEFIPDSFNGNNDDNEVNSKMVNNLVNIIITILLN